VELIFWVDVVVYGSATTPRDCDRIFPVSPLICQAHEVVDGFWLASSQLFPEVTPDEAIPESVDGPFG
jgi:hypothetical protein